MPGVIDSITQAQSRGASSADIVQEIMKQNPDKQATFQQAFSRGAQPDDILNEIVKQNGGQSSSPIVGDPNNSGGDSNKVGAFSAQNLFNPQPQNTGFFGSLVRGIASPLRALGNLGAGISSAIGGAAQKITEQTNPDLQNVNNLVLQKLHSLPANDPRRANLLSALQTNNKAMGITADTSQGIANASPTVGQVAGNAIEGGTTLASFMTGLPATYGGAALQGAGLAGGTTLGEGLEKQKTAGDILKDMAVALPIGAVGGVVAKGATDFLSNLTQKAPESLAQQTVGRYQNKQELIKEAQGKIEPLKEIVLKENPGFTDAGIYAKSLSTIDSTESQIQNVLSSDVGQGTIKTKDVINDLADLKKEYINVLGSDGVKPIEGVEQVLKDKGKTITYQEANELKRNITNTFSKLYQAADPNLSQQQEAYRAVADSLRSRIADALPEVAKLNSTQSKYIRIAQALENKMVRDGNHSFLGLSDLVLGSGFGGNVPAEALAVGAKKLISSTPVRMGVAQALNKLGQSTAASTVANVARKGGQVLLPQAFASLLTGNGNTSQNP